jgi:hypothetical protein
VVPKTLSLDYLKYFWRCPPKVSTGQHVETRYSNAWVSVLAFRGGRIYCSLVPSSDNCTYIVYDVVMHLR